MKTHPLLAILIAVAAAWLLVVLMPAVAAAQYDITAPVITELTFAPTSVDTALGEQTITATARITDDLSGVERVDVHIKPDILDIGQRRFFTFRADNRISGDDKDGIYRMKAEQVRQEDP